MTTMSESQFNKNNITNNNNEPEWDPITQTYRDGIVPAHQSMSMTMEELLKANNGKLKIFGYGSLCWHPGSEGVLSLANIEQDEHDHEQHEHNNNDGNNNSASDETKKSKRKVTTDPGRAIGYQRCWAQRSADHRGTTHFNGIVCTLLSDEEVWALHHHDQHKNDGDEEEGQMKSSSSPSPSIQRPSMTEGLIYTVDEDLVEDCLAELDFREKGGYARDVIDVIEDETGNIVKALLYRGTPDNPAFWKRVYLDLPLAAATMAVAIGPSGHNDVYLLHLDTFLAHAAEHSPAAKLSLEDHKEDDRTSDLAKMVKILQNDYRPYFLFGAGSNEHNQLLSPSDGTPTSGSVDGGANEMQSTGSVGGFYFKEVGEMVEMLLIAPRHNEGNDLSSDQNISHEPVAVYAGGGHSAMLTRGGELYMWGWNQAGQLGRSSDEPSDALHPLLHPVQPLSNIKVEVADLGHNHTLIIEKETGSLFAFGENGRGQVDGCGRSSFSAISDVPTTPLELANETFVNVAAGLFHSAAITTDGTLVTWGCGRFGQCLQPDKKEESTDTSKSTVGRWRTPDGSKLVQVVCGRRHTAVLDEFGRVWTLGDNKYGQLGRSRTPSVVEREPQLVEGLLGQKQSECVAIMSGWSHILALVKSADSQKSVLYGWGRNDKGQLGIQSDEKFVAIPTILNAVKNTGDESISIQSACCGSESSHILDSFGNLWSCGWNEHGNLGIGQQLTQDGADQECSWTWNAVSGARIVAPPPSKGEGKIFAAGGAHFIAMAT